MSSLFDLFAAILDFVTWPFLIKQRNRELTQRLARTESTCLHCGGKFPAKASVCSACGWSFESSEVERQ